MASEWHYQHGGQRHGPVSSVQLKELAATGGLDPSDLVWKDGMAEWTPARRLNGLFTPSVPSPMPPPVPPTPVAVPPGQPAQPPPLGPPASSNVPSPSLQSKTLSGPEAAKQAANPTPTWLYPALAVLSLTCCFPLGLFLIWRNPAWSNKTKTIWTATWGGVVMGLAVIGGAMEHATHKRYAEANAMWESGRKAESVERYRELISNNFEYVERDRPTILRRVIEYDADTNNAEEARTLIEKAMDDNLSMTFGSPKAAALWADVRTQRATEEKRKEDERRIAEAKRKEDESHPGASAKDDVNDTAGPLANFTGIWIAPNGSELTIYPGGTAQLRSKPFNPVALTYDIQSSGFAKGQVIAISGLPGVETLSGVITQPNKMVLLSSTGTSIEFKRR